MRRLLPLLFLPLLAAGCATPCGGEGAAQARFAWPTAIPIADAASVLREEGWNVSLLADGSGVLGHVKVNDSVVVRASVLRAAGDPEGTTRVFFYVDGVKVRSDDEARALLSPWAQPLQMRLQAKLGDPTESTYAGGAGC